MKDINIILTRHGRYNNSRDKNDLSIGHITEEGRAEIENKTRLRLSRLVGSKLLDTIFLVVSSPTYWLSDRRLGQRAVETEKITKKTIEEELRILGLDEIEIKKHFYSKPNSYTRNLKNTISIEELREKLAEPNVYNEAPEYIKSLTLKHGGMNSGFWEELASSEEVKRFNKNAEGPSDLNTRIRQALNYVVKWSKDYSQDYDKNICVFLITHGETMEPFINKRHLSDIAEFGYNEGLVFNVREDGIIIKSENDKFIGPPKKVEDDIVLGRD